MPLRGDVRGTAPEGWTLLGALAAQTSRLQLGTMVTSNRLRPPAVLAKMAVTVDHISDGRLVLGLGAGGSRVRDPEGFELVRRELEAYGIDIVTPAAAAGALAEACTLIRRMWTEAEPFDFDGHHYRLRGAVCEPKPLQRPHPPILLGSGGERLGLRVVAEHADIWSCPVWTAEEFERKSAVLDEHCAAIDRDPSQIRRSVQVLVSGDDSLAARRSLADFVAAGADHLVLAPRAPYPTARWLATEVVEPVRDQVAA